WTLVVVLVLVVIVVALALVLLYSSGAFAWAAGLALGAYNERIPVAIEVAIDGRLADDLRLAGLVARDRDGRTLLEIDALELRWSAWALLAGDLRVDALRSEE